MVPVQADPGMVRAWLTWVPGSNPTQDPVQLAVDAFALGERDGCRANKVAIERREGARRAYVYPVGDPVEPQLVGEFVLDVDLTRARAASSSFDKCWREAESLFRRLATL